MGQVTALTLQAGILLWKVDDVSAATPVTPAIGVTIPFELYQSIEGSTYQTSFIFQRLHKSCYNVGWKLLMGS
ncbi:hypothetical protein Bpfe_021721 [Biomphalaria pfeifferi]|uniref:Uncharacterized protein n=1 Tax=Biomphalaria pfeifferi TaxID=112525 RepID=A0AAD8B6J0_BIOPF|nr:hypothetical protein Bpfe_021721 [Biomphalaria pfeifferi]